MWTRSGAALLANRTGQEECRWRLTTPHKLQAEARSRKRAGRRLVVYASRRPMAEACQLHAVVRAQRSPGPGGDGLLDESRNRATALPARVKLSGQENGACGGNQGRVGG
jgi:hypothetical protein